jgi:hypothetical protein
MECRAMKHLTNFHVKRTVPKVLLSWGCLAVAVVLVSRPSSSGQRLIETRSWNLAQFVRHLQANPLALRVVPTHKSGNWSNSVYLTTDAEANWQSLQMLSRTVEKIDDWNGIVLVERTTTTPGPQWDVSQWGKNGLRIDRFMVFGDAILVRQIEESVVVPDSTCTILRWLHAE